MFGALMEAGGLGLPREAYGNAFKVTFAKKPKLIPLNLEILEAGAQAVRVLRMAGCRRDEELGRSNEKDRVIKIIFIQFLVKGF